MRYVECPKEYVRWSVTEYAVFLAGGITGCDDWQMDVNRVLQRVSTDVRNLVLVNPRRKDFDITSTKMSDDQISWEYKHLNLVDEILFWFPKEGMCQITMFELGWALGANKKVNVGCHPEFCRAYDVKEQVKLRQPWVTVVPDLSQLISRYA